MKISASEKVMKHVFGDHNYDQFVNEQSRGDCAWLNRYGANVRIDDKDHRCMPSPITYEDNSPVYNWVISGHHAGEAEETIQHIEEAKKYIDNLNKYRYRASTKRQSNGLYIPTIVCEKWNKKTCKWGSKSVVFNGIESVKNRSIDTLENISALTIASKIIKEYFPKTYF